MNKINFHGTFVIIGFGSIGSGIIPLICTHFSNPKIKVITKDDRNLDVVKWFNKEKQRLIIQASSAQILLTIT